MGYFAPIRTWLRQDSNDGQGLGPCSPGGSFANLALPGFAGRSSVSSIHSSGEVPEWLKGADCKSAGSGLRGFESLSHQSLPPARTPVGGSASGRLGFHSKLCGCYSDRLKGSAALLVSSSTQFHFGPNMLPSPHLTVVAQLVEQRIPNPQVGGSIPSDRA